MHSIESSRSATDIHELTLSDKRYPDRLRNLSDLPPVLYVRGNVELLARERLVAVVGTREPTVFGTSAAQELTGVLADDGWGIVSGLARGIDTIAHRTALEHGAPTIAVMGGGLDRVYPAENEGMAAQIIDSGGALISEQPFGEQARPQHLIARDRLQSGLSVAVVVAQSGCRSGTMHTVRFAAHPGAPVVLSGSAQREPASEGLRVLLEKPARELCSILPAWRGAKALCERLGDQPLARPVTRDGLEEFVGAVERSIEVE